MELIVKLVCRLANQGEGALRDVGLGFGARREAVTGLDGPLGALLWLGIAEVWA